MRYRRLGQSGLRVSEISLGTWLTHGTSSRDVAIDCTRRAHELGVNLFDTADAYQSGEAEVILGEALAPLERGSYLIATKIYSQSGSGVLQVGLSRKHIMEQVDKSLRRLNVEHIDLYQCHRFDPNVPVEETAAAMNDLIRHGKILYWGVSSWPAHGITEVHELCVSRGWSPPISNQPQYSALWREAESEILPTCQALGLGTLAFSPLAHGVLTGKYEPDTEAPPGSRGSGPNSWVIERYHRAGVLEAVQRFRGIADDAGCQASQLALTWCLHNPAVSSAIIGASNVKHLEEAIAASDLNVLPTIIEAAGTHLAPFAVG